MSTYLKINIAIIVIPLLLSFDKKVQFYKKWKFAVPAILITGIVFIIWDIWFTKIGVWRFNTEHLTGITFFGLPIEEFLFFITVPYASLFTYETLKSYWPQLNPQYLAKNTLTILSIVLITAGIYYNKRIYTFTTFISTSIILLIVMYVFKYKYVGRFLIAFILITIPFTIFNGILTGSGIEQPVVIYNNYENVGFRLLTIPLEDSIYGLLLILSNVFLFDLFRKQN